MGFIRASMTNGRLCRGSTRPASGLSAPNFALFAKGTTNLGAVDHLSLSRSLIAAVSAGSIRDMR